MKKSATVIYESLRFFDSVTRRRIGHIVFDPSSKMPHREAVIDLCKEAMRKGHPFVTYARLSETRFRRWEVKVADFIDLEENLVVEIADTESDKSLEKKRLFWEDLGFDFVAKRINTKSIP